MIEEEHVRQDDRCPTCATPMEVAEVISRDETGPRELVLRCANGHEIHVRREEETTAADDGDI